MVLNNAPYGQVVFIKLIKIRKIGFGVPFHTCISVCMFQNVMVVSCVRPPSE